MSRLTVNLRNLRQVICLYQWVKWRWWRNEKDFWVALLSTQKTSGERGAGYVLTRFYTNIELKGKMKKKEKTDRRFLKKRV